MLAQATAEVTAALALDLARHAAQAAGPLLFIDATGDRLDELAAAAAAFDPAVAVLALPAWDSLPYDRLPPSPAIVGRRVATLARLGAGIAGPCLVLTSARAVMSRVQPPAHWTAALLALAPGDDADTAALGERLRAFGYGDDEKVDEPGHIAVRAHILDVFPGDADMPFRVITAHGRVAAIHPVDGGSQRSAAQEMSQLLLRPVQELSPFAMVSGPDATADLVCVLDALPQATALLHPEVETRWAELHEQVLDAHAATTRARQAGADGPGYVPPPSRLFMTPEELAAGLARLGARPADRLGQAHPLPAVESPAALAPALRAALAQGRVVVGAGPGADRVGAALGRRKGLKLRRAAGWADALAGPADTVAIAPLPIAAGFSRDGLSLFAVPAEAARRSRPAGLAVEEPPREGDIVVHREHGVCRLQGLAPVGAEERVMLEFADGTDLLAPTDELDQLWRYGTEAGHIALDRVDGEGWRRRCHEIGQQIAATAQQLAAEAAARAALIAPAIRPPAAYARFARRFPYPLSPDQSDAIEATLADLASGHPMDRLVCGDVGFGKTEVALRATAAAALAGCQVAVVAPTTVLARQHLDTFTRRFKGLGVRVEPLLRGAAGGEVRAGLADGSIAVVVGTHAVAAPGVRFQNLALVVIDEEQRFGDAQKKRLAGLRNPEGGVHALVMSATPIPRTLQAAMVGLRTVSVIATAPVRRQPTRTFTLPWDAAIVREALLRERARGGQSFVVCPRIEDLDGIAARLAEAAPELSVVAAHGKLKPQVLEERVAGFAAGEGDVLLATNIIEAGLDIPCANTILITRPDRFGLSQLHQMRGRVGRSTRRSFAYLLTEPGQALSAVTVRRLRTLEAQAQLGAGVAISMADMDARGAGELFGERQAGHVHAIGTELYQHLLAIELAAGRGESRPAPPPQLRTEVAARIPEELVPEVSLRVQLYRRLARLPDPAAADAFADELADRFGDLPEPALRLLDLARLRAWCVARRVVRLDAGPQAVALTPHDPAEAEALADKVALPAKVKDGRVIVALAVADPVERLGALLAGLGLG